MHIVYKCGNIMSKRIGWVSHMTVTWLSHDCHNGSHMILRLSRDTTEALGDVISRLAPFLRLYSHYTSGFEEAMKTLTDCTKKDRKFDSLVREFEVRTYVATCDGRTYVHTYMYTYVITCDGRIVCCIRNQVIMSFKIILHNKLCIWKLV